MSEFDHDPLCRTHYRRSLPVRYCSDCDLIARVREQERRTRPRWDRPSDLSDPQMGEMIH